jgi:hypothetical protein
MAMRLETDRSAYGAASSRPSPVEGKQNGEH